jgi:hypothetical protein
VVQPQAQQLKLLLLLRYRSMLRMGIRMVRRLSLLDGIGVIGLLWRS